MNRNTVAQQPPHPDVDLRDFPTEDLAEGATVWRAHRASNQPWYFSNRGSGRFDLNRDIALSAARGTCYVADDVESAFREAVGVQANEAGELAGDFADERVVSRLGIIATVKAANVNSSRAVRYGITRELCTMADYDIPQEWAVTFDEVQFESPAAPVPCGGIRYASRFTTTPGPNCWALFGESGQQTSYGTDPLEQIAGRRAAEMSGFTVIDIPPKRSLRILS